MGKNRFMNGEGTIISRLQKLSHLILGILSMIVSTKIFHLICYLLVRVLMI